MNKCKQCGAEFEAKRADAKCCSTSCRSAYCRALSVAKDGLSVASVATDKSLSVANATDKTANATDSVATDKIATDNLKPVATDNATDKVSVPIVGKNGLTLGQIAKRPGGLPDRIVGYCTKCNQELNRELSPHWDILAVCNDCLGNPTEEEERQFQHTISEINEDIKGFLYMYPKDEQEALLAKLRKGDKI